MKVTDEQIQRVKLLALYAGLGLTAAGGLFLVGRKFLREIRSSSAQKHSLEEGDPATFAKQLKMAFDNDNYLGWGTNEQIVFKVFESIPSKSMYTKVQKEYSKLYNRSLNADLEDELSSDEYNQVIRILNAKS